MLRYSPRLAIAGFSKRRRPPPSFHSGKASRTPPPFAEPGLQVRDSVDRPHRRGRTHEQTPRAFGLDQVRLIAVNPETRERGIRRILRNHDARARLPMPFRLRRPGRNSFLEMPDGFGNGLRSERRLDLPPIERDLGPRRNGHKQAGNDSKQPGQADHWCVGDLEKPGIHRAIGVGVP